MKAMYVSCGDGRRGDGDHVRGDSRAGEDGQRARVGVAGISSGVRMFKGIPFAAPPVGENRWRAPQPAAKWDGVRKADAFGPLHRRRRRWRWRRRPRRGARARRCSTGRGPGSRAGAAHRAPQPPCPKTA